MIIIPQIAAGGLFDIFNETYISDISELPFSSGNPQITWQESGHIRAWVDIVGFKNLSKDEEKYFILGDPVSLAVVQYDASGDPPGIKDSIEQNISLSQSEDNLTATLHVILKYHTVYCDDQGCFINGRFTDTATFQDIEVIPEQFNKTLNPKINITEYNNTIEPKISIQATTTNSSRISISYGNKSAVHSTKSFHVEQTDAGIYYANTSDIEAWDIQGHGIARFGNSVVMNMNLSTIDYSHLDIRISNLYESVRVDPSNFNITKVNYQPATVLNNPVLYAFLGVFLTLTGSAYYLIRQAYITL